MKRHILGEAQQTAFGRALAVCLRAPLVLYLVGDLGTGKTTLVRGALRGLGHQGSVRSPTYTLLEPYELAGMRVFHLDLYRLGDPEELEYLGLRDLLDEDSVLFVEWPERGAGVLPPADLEIRLDHSGNGRRLELLARTEAGRSLAAALSERI
jgi:tRNA threonylcarbamoyladenosine biosynthesis protein TsaE